MSGEVRPNSSCFPHAPSEFNPLQNIAPLIRAPHLQRAVVALVQLQEVVALQNHVIEFQERERLLAFQPQLHAVHGEHSIDREMPADVAQKWDVLEARQPVIVVDHHGAGRGIVEAQEVVENLANAGDIGVDLLVGEKLTGLIAARRITDLGRAAAHQHDGAVSRLLQAAQHHDLHQTADVQAVGGGIETDVCADDARAARWSSPAASVCWWMYPRSPSVRRKSDLNSIMVGRSHGLR